MTYNKKSIGPVISFILWALGVLTVCIVGISNVFAATYDSTTFTAQLYDNYGPSLHSVTTDFTNMSWRGTIPGMTANTSGAAWGVSSPIPLIANHTYSMTVKIEGTYGGNIVLSTYNRIGVGTSLSAAKTSYENNTNSTLNYSNAISSNMTLQFAFTPSISSNYIVFPFATDYTGNNQSFYLYNIIIEDLGSGGVNQTDINNSLNNQTNEINNSITNSENNIKDSIKETENNIKDGIKEGFESCRDSYNLFSAIANKGLIWSSGLEFNENNSSISSDFISTESNKVYSSNYKFFIFYYDVNKIYLGNSYDLRKTGGVSNFTQTVPNNSDIKYFKVWYRSADNSGKDMTNKEIMLNEGSTAKSYEKYGEKVCTNRIDDTNKKLDEQNETSKGILGKIKDLFNWFTNDDDADISSAGNVAGWLPAGPVDSLITLPLTFLTNVNTSLSKTCAPLDITLPYVNKNVQIPCLNTIFNQITGVNSFWTWVGTISSVVILFKYLVALYDYFDRLTTLQANFISDWGGI